MAEIGATLRDTRIRNRIDIGSVEAATKIRAKYLRALENEEWGVLPGSTYVKSFLRTYAEYLGLDAHLLVEEFSARYEEPEELEVAAFTPEKPMLRQVQRVPTVPRWGVILGAFVLLVTFLIVLGLTSGDEDKSPAEQGRATAPIAPAPGRAERQNAKPPSKPMLARLTITPTRDVWVCVVDAKGRLRVNGRTLSAGERQGPFTSKRFKITVGNGGGDFTANGRRRDVPETAEPLGYAITASKVRPLPASEQPTCRLA